MNVIIWKDGHKDCLKCDTVRVDDNIVELVELREDENYGMLPQFNYRRVVAQINVDQIDYWYVEDINPLK